MSDSITRVKINDILRDKLVVLRMSNGRWSGHCTASIAEASASGKRWRLLFKGGCRPDVGPFSTGSPRPQVTRKGSGRKRQKHYRLAVLKEQSEVIWKRLCM